MAGRTLMVVDLVELYTHWYAGRDVSALARSLGLDRKTVRKYLAPAVAAGLVPRGEAVAAERWAQLAGTWFPKAADGGIRRSSWPTFDEHAEWIAAQLAAGVSVATVYQRLRDERGVAASEASLRRWAKAKAFGKAAPGATALMPQPAPGDVGEVDYGYMGVWEDPAGGGGTRVNIFVMVLPFSKAVFIYPVTKMDQRAWAAAHVAAFEFFGGAPARIVVDNLKAGVSKPSLYDPRLNRSYAELAEHYGVLIDPARVRSPRDKPHVERAVQYARQSWWRGREFESVEAMRVDAARWSRDVAGRREVRELGGQTPADLFAAVEAPLLVPLVGTPFQIRDWRQAKVARDCHCQVAGCRYSVPYRLVGKTLDVCVKTLAVEFYHDGALVKTHPIRPGRARATDVADYPPNHAAYLSRDAAWCREKAQEVGPACREVVERLMEPYALHHLRSCQGILGFATRYGAPALESACQIALDAGDPGYQTIKNLLRQTRPDADGRRRVQTPQPRPSGDNGAGGILRGPDAFTL